MPLGVSVYRFIGKIGIIPWTSTKGRLRCLRKCLNNGMDRAMFKTAITQMFGVETPIVMGGMTGVGYGDLVAAVANAGALGFILSLIHI